MNSCSFVVISSHPSRQGADHTQPGRMNEPREMKKLPVPGNFLENPSIFRQSLPERMN